jgi:hypothetical protein
MTTNARTIFGLIQAEYILIFSSFSFFFSEISVGSTGEGRIYFVRRSICRGNQRPQMMHRFGSAAGISNGTIFMAKKITAKISRRPVSGVCLENVCQVHSGFTVYCLNFTGNFFQDTSHTRTHPLKHTHMHTHTHTHTRKNDTLINDSV